MAEKDNAGYFKDLRKKAERNLRSDKKQIQKIKEDDTTKIIHELRVHQIELEMQNEELRRAQVELEESRHRYSDLYDFAPVGYFVFNKNGLVIDVNLTGTAMLGRERAGMIKKPFHLYVAGDYQDKFYLHRRKVFDTKAKQTCEVKLVRKDGSQLYALLESDAVEDDEGNPFQCRTAISDITAPKQAEEALQSSNERLADVLGSISDGFFTVDKNFKLTYFNKAAEELLGRKAEEVLGHRLFDEAFPEAKDSTFDQKYKQALRTKKPVAFESYFPVEPYENWYAVRVYPYKDGLSIYFQVITERKQNEEAMKSALEKSRQHSAEASALLESSRAILRSQKFQETAESIFRTCKNLIGATAGYVALLSSDGAENEVLFLDAGGRPCTVDPNLPMPIRGLREQTYLTGKAIYENDFSNSEWVKFMPKGHTSLDNVLFAPLMNDQKVVGLIGLANKPGGFCENDVRMATAFGELASVALQNSRMLESLENSEKRFRSVMESANDAIVCVDHSGDVILWNTAAEAIFGYAPEEILGKPVTFIMPERFHQAHHNGMQRFLSTGISKTVGNAVEVAALRKNGSEFPVEISLSNWKAGGEMFFTAIIRDITERKRAEEQINNLARFPSENPFPVLRILQDGTVLYSNTPGIVLLEQWNCKTGQKAPKDWCKLVSKALESKRYQVKELNCDQKVFSFAIAPVVDEGYVNLYGRDITKRKQAEGALRKSRDELDLKVKQRTAELAQTVTTLQEEVRERIAAEKKLRERTRDLDAFFSNTITPLVILDKDFNFIRVNKAYADADERDISDFDGHNHFEFYPHEENQRIFEGVVKNKTPYQASAKPFTYPDHPEWGVTYWDWTLVPILGDGGEVELLILSLNDVTERKSAELRRDVTSSLLDLFVKTTSRKEYLDSVVEVIHDWSGCRCVGIRLVNSDGCIPYESHVGFSKEFLLTENMLSLNKDICTCVRVVTKDNDPHDDKVMTERGSFRCDDTFGFVNSLAEHERHLYRSHCSKCGLASVAVVPVRYRQNILGAIHVADEGRNKVPLETIEFLEGMAALIGEAVHRFNVEESLRLNEERLLEAQRLAHLGNWEWDIIKNNLWWSDEVYRIFGVEPGQFGATNDAFLSYVHPQDREFVKKSVNETLYEGKSYNIDHRVIRPDGSERIVHEKAEVTYDSNHKPIKMIGTVHDITEQKKTEDEIRENQRKLRALTAELQLVEEQERHRIAQDLHDSVGQILAFSCGGLKTLQKSLPDKAAKSVQKITNQLDTAVEQARTLSFDLSPSTLYDLGFEVAVEDLVDRMAEERKLRCQFENCSLPKPLTDDVKVLLYRSVRELLINAVKHAGASLLRVKLLRSSSDIYITVEDDGEGFDVSALDKYSTKRKGFGIFSISERLSHIGGVLKIESTKGKGTKAVLIAPLDIEKEDDQELTDEYKNNTG
jgi:PAS domain S-box-containing protein